MPAITLIFAAILAVMGVVAYLLSGMASMTALIPTFFAIPLAICGVLAFKEGLRKHAMHGAAALAVIIFLGGSMGFAKLPALFAGSAERPMAVIIQSSMATLMIVFIVLCVRSFIAARKAREASAVVA